jgi:hypothetical protein
MFSVFHELNTQYRLGLRVNKANAQVIEPNGHIIQLHGLKDMNSAELLRGQKFRKIVGDECGTYPSELLKYTVQNVLQPTMLKHKGEMLLSGTPGTEPEGYFYELTGDPYSGLKGMWPTHSWTLFDNPFIEPASVVADILAQNFWTADNPTFVREYMARWVADRGAKIYDWTGIWAPMPTTGTTVLSLDFGYQPDHTSFNVIRSEERPHAHVIRSFSEDQLTPHKIAEVVQELRAQYHPNYIVADEGALGKGYAAELKQQFHIPIEPADKRDKYARIQLLRGMLANDTLHLCHGAEALAEEWQTLVWDTTKRTHHEKSKDDCTDGVLYGLSKLLMTQPYKAPVEVRPANLVEMDKARENARRSAERSTRRNVL